MTMRAGLGHPCDDADAVPPGVDDVARRMMALTVSLVCRAGENAAVYAMHAGRRAAAPRDVNRALQYQAKTFLAAVTDAEVEEAMGDVTRACDDDDTSSSWESDASDEDSGEDSDEGSGEDSGEVPGEGSGDGSGQGEGDEDDDDDDEVWTLSACACETCAGMNEAHDTWDSYAPEDEALAYLKHLTDNFLDKQQQ